MTEKITGYRDLSQGEIDMLNHIKAAGPGLEKKLAVVTQGLTETLSGPELGEALRWVAVSKTHFQQGLMALARAIARPEGF